MKLLKKPNKSNKKYNKKGGILFTRTSKYRDIKTEKKTLQDIVDRLELKLENYNIQILQLFEELENCQKKYKPNPSEEEDRIFTQKGGILGFSLSSNYNAVKDEKISLEQKKDQLLQDINIAKNKIQNFQNRIRICKQINWNNDLKLVEERERQDRAERERQERAERERQEREGQPEELEPTLRCDPFGVCSSRVGKKRKTKKVNKKRKSYSHRKH